MRGLAAHLLDGYIVTVFVVHFLFNSLIGCQKKKLGVRYHNIVISEGWGKGAGAVAPHFLNFANSLLL